MKSKTLTLIFIVLASVGRIASAQDTRADAMRLQQAEKQQRVAPPQTTIAERAIGRLEKWGLGGPPRGLYPWFGSIFPGGGFGGGLGLRQALGDTAALTVRGGYSIDSCVIAAADLGLPSFAQSRGTAALSAQYIHAPMVSFYGLGNDSVKDSVTYYGYSPSQTGAKVDLGLNRRFKVGGELSYLHANTNNLIDTGLTTFNFIRSTARATYDSRSRLGYAGSGGLYKVQFQAVSDRDARGYSFRSVEADALQLIPLVRANWVVAVRAAATLTDADGANDVPYFLMPSIGGGGSVRGYPDFRFTDRNRMVMNAELRWTPARFLDMALFYDAGKVEARKQDLDFKNLKDAFGIGLRLIGLKGYAFRVEAAHSREHNVRLIFSAGGAL